jgi:hypothetical protein
VFLSGVTVAAQSTVTPTANRVQSTGAALTATSSVTIVAVEKWEPVPVTPETWTPQSGTAITWTANSITPETWTPNPVTGETWTKISDTDETWTPRVFPDSLAA